MTLAGVSGEKLLFPLSHSICPSLTMFLYLIDRNINKDLRRLQSGPSPSSNIGCLIASHMRSFELVSPFRPFLALLRWFLNNRVGFVNERGSIAHKIGTYNDVVTLSFRRSASTFSCSSSKLHAWCFSFLKPPYSLKLPTSKNTKNFCLVFRSLSGCFGTSLSFVP